MTDYIINIQCKQVRGRGRSQAPSFELAVASTPPPTRRVLPCPFLHAPMSDYDYGSSRNGDTSPSPNGMAGNGSNGTLPQQQAPAHGLNSVIRKKLMGYVGFANLPNQVHRKSVRKGFQFTTMVVGTWRHYRPLPRCTPAHPPQASLAWESPRSSTPSLTPLYTPRKSLCPLTQSALRPWLSRA
jgi:hypothetical protein